jgi:hypothetical protein
VKSQFAVQNGEGNVQNNFWAERRRLLVAICAAILVVASVSASIVIYLLQPDRAVAEQHAIDADREGRDGATPPVRAESVSGPPGGPGSLASPRLIELDGVMPERAIMQSLIPDGLTLGQEVIDPRHPTRTLPGYGTGVMYFKLTGQNFTPVQISSITAKVVERRRPPTGTIVASFPQGATEALKMGFDFSSGDIVEAKVLDDFGQYTEIDYVKVHAITIALNETLAFEVDVKAQECDCRFVVDVGFADGRSITVDDGGKPFHFATVAGSYERAYVPMFEPYDSSSASRSKLRACVYPDGCKMQYGQVYAK